MIKFKENTIKNQHANTANCGYFCIKFLMDRFSGKRFSDATGFNDIIKQKSIINEKEKNIRNFKKKIQHQVGGRTKKFKYL